jgi:hypothetical protein
MEDEAKNAGIDEVSAYVKTFLGEAKPSRPSLDILEWKDLRHFLISAIQSSTSQVEQLELDFDHILKDEGEWERHISLKHTDFKGRLDYIESVIAGNRQIVRERMKKFQSTCELIRPGLKDYEECQNMLRYFEILQNVLQRV